MCGPGIGWGRPIARLGGLQTLPNQRLQRSYNERRKELARTDFLMPHGQVGHRSLLLRVNDGFYELPPKIPGLHLRHFPRLPTRENSYLEPQYARFKRRTAKPETM